MIIHLAMKKNLLKNICIFFASSVVFLKCRIKKSNESSCHLQWQIFLSVLWIKLLAFLSCQHSHKHVAITLNKISQLLGSRQHRLTWRNIGSVQIETSLKSSQEGAGRKASSPRPKVKQSGNKNRTLKIILLEKKNCDSGRSENTTYQVWRVIRWRLDSVSPILGCAHKNLILERLCDWCACNFVNELCEIVIILNHYKNHFATSGGYQSRLKK
jgi:hypothetical protein